MQQPPPTERVRPGVWSVPVPIPDNPLGYTLVYVLESDRGPVLIDAGWNDPSTLAALEAGLATADLALEDVYGVLVTHHHPDHHGLSETVRRRSGAWIAMHPADTEIVSRARESISDYFVTAAAVLLEAGATEQDLARLPSQETIAAMQPEAPAIPNRLIGDGETMDVPGWVVRAHHTPGHTPGHVCFVLDRYDVLLSGDHILPGISPHIGLFTEERDHDPLGLYLRSLTRFRGMGIREVLPAHQHRFEDLEGRITALVDHHDERLRSILDRLADGPASGWDIATHMPWNRAWEDISPMMKRAALAEALAHLRHLEHRGEVTADSTVRPTLYALSDEADGSDAS